MHAHTVLDRALHWLPSWLPITTTYVCTSLSLKYTVDADAHLLKQLVGERLLGVSSQRKKSYEVRSITMVSLLHIEAWMITIIPHIMNGFYESLADPSPFGKSSTRPLELCWPLWRPLTMRPPSWLDVTKKLGREKIPRAILTGQDFFWLGFGPGHW